MIDNTSLLPKLLDFSGQKGVEYYKFSLLLRKKDYDDDNPCPLSFKDGRRESCVRQWLIHSEEDLGLQLPDMITYTKLFRGRLYLTLDRKSEYKTLQALRTNVDNILDSLYGCPNVPHLNLINRLPMSVTSLDTSSGRVKRWLFDIDKDDHTLAQQVANLCGEHYIAILKTVNGYHVVANKKFHAGNLKLPSSSIEIKSNALTLIYKE